MSDKKLKDSLNVLKFKNRVMEPEEAKSTIIGWDPDKVAMMKRARDEKILLLGECYEDANGIKADWAHFDFMVAIHGRAYQHWQGDTLTLLKMFWGDFWGYLDPLLKSYQIISENLDTVMDDADETVRDYADLKMRLDLYEEWMNKHCPRDQKVKFNAYYNGNIDRINSEIERLQNDPEYKQAEEDRIKADYQKIKADKDSESER